MPKLIDDQKVYQATIEEVLQKGYTGATMKRIAQQANISELTLFRKYKSKAELIAAAVANNLRELSQEEIYVFTGDISADLLRIVQAFSRSSKRLDWLFVLIMSEMSRYPELNKALDTPNQFIYKIEKIVRCYQIEGVLCDSVQPLHIVEALLGPLIINSMLRQGNPGLSSTPISPQEHIKQFLNGYLRHKE